ncbi:hypothetical protein BDR07DRAFT_1373201, partial [Suillus spraguei]
PAPALAPVSTPSLLPPPLPNPASLSTDALAPAPALAPVSIPNAQSDRPAGLSTSLSILLPPSLSNATSLATDTLAPAPALAPVSTRNAQSDQPAVLQYDCWDEVAGVELAGHSDEMGWNDDQDWNDGSDHGSRLTVDHNHLDQQPPCLLSDQFDDIFNKRRAPVAGGNLARSCRKRQLSTCQGSQAIRKNHATVMCQLPTPAVLGLFVELEIVDRIVNLVDANAFDPLSMGVRLNDIALVRQNFNASGKPHQDIHSQYALQLDACIDLQTCQKLANMAHLIRLVRDAGGAIG